MSEWQPIETAPKNGSFFIGYEKGYGVNKTYFDWMYDGERGGFRVYESHGWSPTHWVPLPEAPK